MLDKKQNQAVFLFTFKMGCKALETIHNINNAFGSGTANECTVQWWSKKFCKEDRAMMIRSAVADHRKVTMTS